MNTVQQVNILSPEFKWPVPLTYVQFPIMRSATFASLHISQYHSVAELHIIRSQRVISITAAYTPSTACPIRR
jgi:hypothetical protein